MEKYDKICEDAYVNAKKISVTRNSQWLDSPWPGFFEGRDPMKMVETSITTEIIDRIGHMIGSPPDDTNFSVHPGKWHGSDYKEELPVTFPYCRFLCLNFPRYRFPFVLKTIDTDVL